MEGKMGMMGSSSTSSTFTSDLFGSKELSGSSSSAGIFASIFAPSTRVVERETVRSDVVEKKEEFGSQIWNTKPGTPDCTSPWSSKGKNQWVPTLPSQDNSSFYQEPIMQPCHLSSSIYYGGQDFYINPQTTQIPGYSTFDKDGVEDDDSASRGNWWKGSLYY